MEDIDYNKRIEKTLSKLSSTEKYLLKSIDEIEIDYENFKQFEDNAKNTLTDNKLKNTIIILTEFNKVLRETFFILHKLNQTKIEK